MSLPIARKVRVKICGITNRHDAERAIALGADALGFNLFSGSKRFIDLEENASWIRALPPFVTRVAVLVNLPLSEARELASHPALDLLQFHGDEDFAYCAEFARLGRPFIKAIRLGSADAIATAADFSTPNLLVDALVPGAFGGTGHRIDLSLARELAMRHPQLALILAGGLTSANVAEAVSRVDPYAVDVASGVESDPRHKSLEKMRAFLEAARGAGQAA
ncbi:MAG: phosphoribosylanthranilate isomerase [Verrucomicrobiota bacterium]